jgi:hypothetical protein
LAQRVLLLLLNGRLDEGLLDFSLRLVVVLLLVRRLLELRLFLLVGPALRSFNLLL